MAKIEVNQGLNPEETQWSEVLERYGFGRADEFDEVLARGVADGYFDPAAVKATADQKNALIKDIRNKFAHSFDAVSFNEQSIRDKCANFVLVDKYIGDFDEAEAAAYLQAMKAGKAPPFNPQREKMIRYTGATEALKKPRERYVSTVQLFGFFLGGPLSSRDERQSRKPFI